MSSERIQGLRRESKGGMKMANKRKRKELSRLTDLLRAEETL